MLISALLIGFAGLLLVAEWLWPKRAPLKGKAVRWRTHLGFVLVNMPLERAVQAAVFVAVYGSITGWTGGNVMTTPDFGLFGALAWPFWLEAVLAILALDFAVWVQHVLTHRVPILWRLHKVHHADVDIDMSTALRFHPLEIALSMLFKMAVALALGASLLAIIIFELLLALLPLFNHANLALPRRVDKILRLILVTPDMHRVHHSVIMHETNSNFGFCFSLWDRLARVYRAQPEAGHQGMTIGLSDYQTEDPKRFGWSMKLPFSR